MLFLSPDSGSIVARDLEGSPVKRGLMGRERSTTICAGSLLFSCGEQRLKCHRKAARKFAEAVVWIDELKRFALVELERPPKHAEAMRMHPREMASPSLPEQRPTCRHPTLLHPRSTTVDSLVKASTANQLD